MENDFTQGKINKNFFIKTKEEDFLIIQVYVVDIILGATNNLLCQEFSNLISKELKMSMLGELNFFVGLQIKQCQVGIFINQGKYVK